MLRRTLTSLMMCLALSAQAQNAQPPLQTSGALVIVPAQGEIRHPNDEARATFAVEEQDKDKAAAASRVNLKMKQGIELLKKEDPKARLKTRGYYTYPVYPEDSGRQPGRTRQPTGWRVGQFVDLTTTNLGALEKTVAAAQRVLALNGLQFGLSDEKRRELDRQGIAAAYRNLTERIAAIAAAMGRRPADAVLDTVDFEGSGAYAPQQEARGKLMGMASAEAAQVEEPSFEPGETTLQIRVVGKVKFK
jgi:predicted secreted protein